jgi:hypothetical protein
MTARGKSWTAIIEELENGDLVLPFPQDMLDEVGWNPGDNLEWHDRGDGTWELRKKNQQSENGDS